MRKELQKQFDLMQEQEVLFSANISGSDLWQLYLNSLENDPVFRDPNSTAHNCNNCHNFIKRYGNIVAVNSEGKIMTIFDRVKDPKYEATANVLSMAIVESGIENIFVETYDMLNSLPYDKCKKSDEEFQLGIASNVKQYTKDEAEKFGKVKPGEIITFEHMNLRIKRKFIDFTGKSVENIRGFHLTKYQVLKRGLEEIPMDTLLLVRDLVNQGSLLNADSYLQSLENFITIKETAAEYNGNDAALWLLSYRVTEGEAKFKNNLMGTLCSELAEGKELNKACEDWNKRVDPVNYMRATAPITKKQIEEAQKFVEENGYEESFERRFATIDDIKVSEILFSNMNTDKPKSISVFDGIKATSTRHKRSEFDNVEEVSIDKFMKDILPNCSGVEAFLTNSHESNMVSLTTSVNPESKRIFKWNNNYSWTFNGNLAGKSEIKEAVKLEGGNVDGVLRGSVIWNYDEARTDNSDLDNWCQQPNSERIGYSTGFRRDRGNKFSSCSGQLDLDNTGPGQSIGVENIYFTDLNRMKDGKYLFWVHQFADRGSKGFKYEIEFQGETYQYDYPQRVSGNIRVATVTLKNGTFSIEHHLPLSGGSTKEIYGLESNQFHKVNLVCSSPNHWGDNEVGNKHYFFMLEGCKSPVSIRGFHNENLNSGLLKHRKVMEVLGTTKMVPVADRQLSGLGFNATVRDEVVLKLSGNFKRVIKVKF